MLAEFAFGCAVHFQHPERRAVALQMRLVVIIVAALTIVGVAALGLVLAQKGGTPTATAASTVRIASVTQEVPTRAPVSQIAQATGSETSPLILLANVDAQAGSPMTTVAQAPSAAAAAPDVKDQSPSTISKAMIHETTRLKDDSTGWANKLQELELDLNLQLDLKKNQDLEATGKDINECLAVLRAAAGRLAPDAETRVTLRKQEVAVRDRAIRAEVHLDPDIRKTAGYFQQKTTELHAFNRSVEEIRTRLVTQIDRLEELKIQLGIVTAAQIGDAVKGGEVSLNDIQAIAEDAQRMVADFDGFGRASAVISEPAEAAKPVEVDTPMLILVRPSPDTGQAKRKTRISVTRRFSTASSSQTSSSSSRPPHHQSSRRTKHQQLPRPPRPNPSYSTYPPSIRVSCFIQI